MPHRGRFCDTPFADAQSIVHEHFFTSCLRELIGDVRMNPLEVLLEVDAEE